MLLELNIFRYHNELNRRNKTVFKNFAFLDFLHVKEIDFKYFIQIETLIEVIWFFLSVFSFSIGN